MLISMVGIVVGEIKKALQLILLLILIISLLQKPYNIFNG